MLAISTRPTVVSHGGVKGTCPSERTLSDEHVRAIAAGGGVIGIGYWETAVCGREPRQVVAAMRHVVSLVGDDFVGLGSDYDGATTVGFDTSQLAALTQQLISEGFSDAVDPEDSRRQRRARPARGASGAMTIARAARLLAGCAGLACAGGALEPAVDLTPFTWTWSQVSLGDTLIRYGFPNEPAPEEPAEAVDTAAFALVPVGPGASERPLAAFRYGCARAGREMGAPCTVFLDFRLFEFEPPLAGVTLAAHRARLEQVYGAPPGGESALPVVRDSHGREWYHRALRARIGRRPRALLASDRRPAGAGGDLLHDPSARSRRRARSRARGDRPRSLLRRGQVNPLRSR